MGTLYFALQPDADAAEQIADLAERIAFEYDLAPPQPTDRLHLSLAGMGPFSTTHLTRAIEIGSSIWAPAVEVTLGGIARFGGDPAPLVLAVQEPEALQTLYAKFYQAMGVTPPISPALFLPHITLLYDNAAPEHLALEAPIHWNAQEFVLIHSDGGHEIVARWPLRG
ncbi:MAG: 2'-5' RNA ligase family protein [Proteobacteria bacterium]|nr:2'-5' RNA ligase family protein [Pseudomonadota bacterium]